MKPRIIAFSPVYLIIGVAVLLFAGWLGAGAFATRRQIRLLGYDGPPSRFHSDFIAQRIKPGTPPRVAYQVLSPGARVRYYLERTVGADSVVIQFFDYSVLGTGPYVAVLYRRTDTSATPTVFDVYTDSYGTGGEERIPDELAYSALHWHPSK